MFNKVLTKDIYIAKIGEGINQHVKFMICKAKHNIEIGQREILAGWLLKEDKAVEIKCVGSGAFHYNEKKCQIIRYYNENYEDISFIGPLYKYLEKHASEDLFPTLNTMLISKEFDLLFPQPIHSKRYLIELEDKINQALIEAAKQQELEKNEEENDDLYEEDEIESNYPFNQ